MLDARRAFLRATVLTAGLILPPAACAPGPDADRLSVVFVSVDTLRADRLGCYGHERAVAPEMDRLAREGTRFATCTSSAPMTFPSHATMMTGVYPFVHGARNNGSFLLAEENLTLAEILDEAGYATHAEIGAAVLEAETGLDQGFDGYGDSFVASTIAAGEVEAGLMVQRDARAVTDAALEYLETRRAEDEPFFLFVHYYDPHLPYQAPPAFAAKYKSGYLAEIAYTDSELGRLFATLREPSFEGRTLVVLTSDHGDGLGEHGELSHGTFLYETTLSVPLLIKVPGLSGGRVVHSPVGLVDLLPTVLELVGLDVPPGLQGQSLASLVREPGAELELTTYSETFEPRMTFGYSELRALRAGDWKYIHGPAPELYEVARDPGETEDRAPVDPGRLADMRASMRQLIADAPPLLGRGAARELDSEEIQALAALGYAADSGPFDEDDPHAWTDELSHFETDGINPMDHARDIFVLYTAMANMQEGSFEAARGNWEEYLGRNPDDASGHASLARCLAVLEEDAAALESLARAVELEPDRCDDHQMMGALLAEAGRLAEARAPLERALACDPEHALAALNLGRLRWMNGEAGEALEALDVAVRYTPENPKAHSLRAQALRELGRVEEAESALREVIKLSPRDAQARVELASLLQDTGRLDDALLVHDESLRILPRNVSIRAAAARFWIERGEAARALELLEDGLRQRPEAVLLAALRVRVLATASDASIRDGARALQLAGRLLQGGHGEDPRVLGGAAAAEAEEGDFERATQLAQEAIEFARERDADALVERLEGELELYRAGRPARMK